MSKRRGPYAGAVRNRAAVTHQVVTVVALGGFDGTERFPYRHYRPPGHAEKVRDQSFDVMHGAVFHRRRSQRVIRFVGTLGHMLDALLDDAKALPHLLDTHRRAVVTVAVFAGWNFEFKLLIPGVGLALAKIPFQSTGAKVGAGDAPLDRLVHAELAYSFRPRFENRVSHHSAVILDEARRQVLYEIAEHFLPASGQVGGDPANAKPSRVHACAGDRFDDFEGALAVVESEKDRRHLSEVLGKSAIPDEVADDAEQLTHHHANDLGAGRYLDGGELLHRRQIGQVIQHAAEVVHAVGVGDVGVPGLALAHLFSAAMVEANFWNNVDDLFAIELQREA